MKIYLAGPINGCTDEQANDWRTYVKQWITNFKDPMDRDYRGRETENVYDIVRGDKNDIQSCDAVLAYCPFPSHGTAMEIHYASHSLGKHVVAVVPDGVAVSPWVTAHATVVRTLDDGIRAVFHGCQ